MKKGISPILSVVLLVAVTVSVLGIFSNFAPNLLSNTITQVENQAQNQIDCESAGVQITSTSYTDGLLTVTLRNTGQSKLQNIQVASFTQDGVVSKVTEGITVYTSNVTSVAQVGPYADYVKTFSGTCGSIEVQKEVQNTYEPSQQDFQSAPTKQFVRSLTPLRIRDSYESKGLTDVATVGDGGEYSSIQTAINNLDDGDTIIILQGMYAWDNVDIDKSIHIVGEEGVIVNGSDSSSNTAMTIGTSADPVIKNLKIWGYSTAIDAAQTQGDWAVGSLQISSSGSDIGPFESKGDWMVLDSYIDGSYAGTHYTNINAPRSTGNVTIERVYVRNGFYPINLNGANGSVNIQFSNIGGARGVYYEGSVDKDDAVVQIRNSYFRGNYQGAIHAVDDAPEVDARFNYWDESDYDSVQDENVDSSNPNIAADTSIHYLIPTPTRPILGS